MRDLSENQRLSAVGGICSVLVACAGFIALGGGVGILYASILLAITLVTAAVGVAYARNRELGWGVALLIAAGLPLFYPLYAIGAIILRDLGRAVAGGLLLMISGMIAIGAIVLATKATHRGTRAHGP